MSNSIKPKSKQVFGYYLKHAWRYPLDVMGIIFGIPLTVLTNNILPSLIISGALRRLTAHDFVAGQVWQSFHKEILTFLGVGLLGSVVMWRLVDFFVWRLEMKVPRNIANQIFNYLVEQSADFHANNFGGSLVSHTNKTLSSYVRIADTTYYSVMTLLSGIVITSIIMFSRAPLYVVALLGLSSLYLITTFLMSAKTRRAGAVLAGAESKQTGYLSDVISNVMAVKSFSGEQFEKQEFAKVTENTKHKTFKMAVAQQIQMMYFSTANRIISTGALVVAIISVVSFKADIATAFLILSYTSTIVDQLFGFSNQSLRNYNRAIGDSYEMIRKLSLKPEVVDPQAPEMLRVNRGQVEFKAVNFRHSGAKTDIFNNLNLKIKPGEKVGLIGHSGSGKTSLTRILLRFSDIQSGQILIDGQNIAAITQADLRSVIAYVPQEPLLFHRSIEENIAYGRPAAGIDEIKAVARKANAEEFVKDLPNGYQTLVGERGVKLSGGQRQRIAIARAMIKNAPILVLDEATSALDSESEALIQDGLWKLMEGRTAIVIAHRLSTIQKMDRIIVLDNGQIVEQGTHKELVNKANGVYASLWLRQSGGFLEE